MALPNRRKFLTGAASLTGLLFAKESFGSNIALTEPTDSPALSKKADLMTEVRKYRKIDSHAHVYFNSPDADEVVDIADRLHIGKGILRNSLIVTTWCSGQPKNIRHVFSPK